MAFAFAYTALARFFFFNRLLYGLRLDSESRVQPKGSIQFSALVFSRRKFCTPLSCVRLFHGMGNVLSPFLLLMRLCHRGRRLF